MSDQLRIIPAVTGFDAEAQTEGASYLEEPSTPASNVIPFRRIDDGLMNPYGIVDLYGIGVPRVDYTSAKVIADILHRKSNRQCPKRSCAQAALDLISRASLGKGWG